MLTIVDKATIMLVICSPLNDHILSSRISNGKRALKTLLTIFEDHIQWRSQLLRLARSDLIKTYRGSALGWAWAFIKPVVTIFVFWFAFSVGLRSGKPVDGHPFFLWLVAGFLPWFYMSEMITGGAGCIRKNKHLVTKMKFPVSIIPTFTSLSKFAVHVVLFLITVVIFVLFGYYPDIYMVQIPVYMLMMFVFFTLWGLFAGMLSAMSKDFQNLVGAFTTAIFWMSGILYDVNSIHIDWVRSAMSYNPVTIVASGYRHVFIDKTWFFENSTELRCYIIIMVIMAICAIWAYRKLYKDIPDVL